MKQSVILCVPDLHFPYHHADTFRFLRYLKEKLQPTMVVQMGDIVDQHSLGRWTPEPDAEGTNEELNEARLNIATLGKLFPHMNLILGNHDMRVLKRFKDLRIPSAFMRDLNSVYGMPPNWKVQDNLVVNDIRFFHGDGFSGKLAAITAAERYRQSCVIGHTHSYAGVTYSAGPSNTVFGLNAGCLIDAPALAFHYAKDYPHKPVLGCGVIIDGVPQFIPLG